MLEPALHMAVEFLRFHVAERRLHLGHQAAGAEVLLEFLLRVLALPAVHQQREDEAALEHQQQRATEDPAPVGLQPRGAVEAELRAGRKTPLRNAQPLELAAVDDGAEAREALRWDG